MAHDEYAKEQQQNAAKHQLRRYIRVVAVNECRQHKGENDGAREYLARTLLVLCTFESNRILPHIFIECLFQ